jgi:hypothetical protein
LRAKSMLGNTKSNKRKQLCSKIELPGFPIAPLVGDSKTTPLAKIRPDQ